MKKSGKKILSLLLILVMVLGLVPGMSLTAYAAETSESFRTNQQMNTYTGEHFTISCQNRGDSDGFWLNANLRAIISARNGETITKVEFTRGYSNINNLRSATGDVTYSGDVATVSNVNANSLTVYASKGLQIKAVTVYYSSGYNVTITGGANAATSGGETSQTGLTGAMTTVTYTANSGYTFPAFSNSTTNGVTLTRVSDTVVTVSGTPTANVNITVPDAAAIPTYTVTYEANNGSGETRTGGPYDAGTTYTVEGCSFAAPEGKEFDCWQGSDGNTYKVGAPVVLTADLTLTAQWKDTAPAPVPEAPQSIGPDIVFIGGFEAEESWEYVGGQQHAWKASFAPMQGGRAQLVLNNGETAELMDIYPGTTVWVNAIPDPGYRVASIVWSYIDGSASFDITETKNFIMPAMEVVVFVTFQPIG